MKKPRTVRRQLPLIPSPSDTEDTNAVTRERLSAADLFASQCRLRRLIPFEREFMFAQGMGRKWRADFAWRRYGVLVEIEGLCVRRLAGQLVVMGRHASIQGFREDCIKYASAALLGFTVLRFEQTQVRDKTALDYVTQVLISKGWTGE